MPSRLMQEGSVSHLEPRRNSDYRCKVRPLSLPGEKARSQAAIDHYKPFLLTHQAF